MNEYEVLGAYVVFALLVFLGGILWTRHSKAIKKRFRLLNYGHTDEESQKPTHTHA